MRRNPFYLVIMMLLQSCVRLLQHPILHVCQLTTAQDYIISLKYAPLQCIYLQSRYQCSVK